MRPTRRSAPSLTTLSLATALTIPALTMPALTLPASAQEAGFTHAVEGGQVAIHPVDHASFALETPAGVILVDPVGGAAAYADLPAPDLILITHEHGDHYDQPTLDALP